MARFLRADFVLALRTPPKLLYYNTPPCILSHKVKERKQRIKKKHLNTNFTGLSWDFWGEFCLCVFPHKEWPEKKHINKFLAPTQSRDNPTNLFMFIRDRKKGVITKGVFSLKKSLESLDSLESLENGWTFLCFPQAGGSLESLESLNSLESLENGRSSKDPFSKRPLFPEFVYVYVWFLSLKISSVQTRCIVKARLRKVRFSGDFLGVFDFLRVACSLGIPQENL